MANKTSDDRNRDEPIPGAAQDEQIRGVADDDDDEFDDTDDLDEEEDEEGSTF
jgi:hypothetical protein